LSQILWSSGRKKHLFTGPKYIHTFNLVNRSPAYLCALAAVALTLGLAACGGGSTATESASIGRTASTGTATPTGVTEPAGTTPAKLPAGVVAKLGDLVISKAELNHWMHTIVGEDFHHRVQLIAPKNIVSEPIDYPSCELAVAAVREKRNPKAKRPIARTPAEICRIFYEAVKSQAMIALLLDLDNRAEAKDLGVTTSAADVAAAFKQKRASTFPTEAALSNYLRQRGMSLADELRLVREQVISNKVREKIETKGGPHAYYAYAGKELKQLVSATLCRPGYVAEGCRGFTQPQTLPTSVASVTEELSGVTY
jgi:hypothetical protein